MSKRIYLELPIDADLSEVSPTYNQDEWSLEQIGYVDNEQRHVVVHSNGA